MLVSNLVLHLRGKGAARITLLLFALVTPAAALLTSFFGEHYEQAHSAIVLLLPVVAGSFIHIATTIFFESGTSMHALNSRKLLAIIAGVCMSLFTLMFE